MARTCRYDLSSADFDAATASDPIIAAIQGPVLQGAAFFPMLLRVMRPRCTDMLVNRVTVAVLRALEACWSRLPVNDFGALLMASELRQLQTTMSTHIAAGSLRPVFARALQITQVLGIETVSDLYSLAFPVPMLTRGEVLGLLRVKVGLLPTANPAQRDAVLDAIQWHRVPVKDREGAAA